MSEPGSRAVRLLRAIGEHPLNALTLFICLSTTAASLYLLSRQQRQLAEAIAASSAASAPRKKRPGRPPKSAALSASASPQVASSSSSSSSSESSVGSLVFWDLETTIPTRKGEAQEIIEFGCIVVDPCSYVERSSFSTLIYSNKVTSKSIECNKITDDMLRGAPQFDDVADDIYQLLHGRVWLGHNLQRFDVPLLERAFAKLNRPAPVPLCVVDTLLLFQNICRNRVADHKLATYGRRYELGEEQHRSVDDCRMNLQVLKNCAMQYLLETNYGLVTHADNTVHYSPAARSSSAPAGRSAGAAAATASSSSTSAASERPPDPAIVQTIDDAMESKSPLYIIYSLHPDTVRCIRPRSWVDKPRKFVSYCEKDSMDKHFLSWKVLEARTAPWSPAAPVDETPAQTDQPINIDHVDNH